MLTNAFYWDRDDETRAWSKRFFEQMKRMPHMGDAGDYSSTVHYLKAVQAAGTDDAQSVMAKMREISVNDFFAKDGRIREDGRMLHDSMSMRSKNLRNRKVTGTNTSFARSFPVVRHSALFRKVPAH